MGFGFNGWRRMEKDGEGWRRKEALKKQNLHTGVRKKTLSSQILIKIL